MATLVDQKGADAAQIEDFDKDKHTADLVAAQQATLQEAKGILETIREDKKLFMVVAAALVGFIFTHSIMGAFIVVETNLVTLRRVPLFLEPIQQRSTL